jgi:hypothetical protein
MYAIQFVCVRAEAYDIGYGAYNSCGELVNRRELEVQ